MNRNEFMSQLTRRLGYLPYEEVKKTLAFYEEAIDDRMEDGASEEEAVAALGSIDDIVRETEQSLPLTVLMREKIKTSKKRTGSSTLWIILAICGSPIWLSIAVTIFAVILSVYVTIWSVIAALFAALAAVLVSGAAAAVASFLLPYPGFAPRLMLCGMGLVIAGVAVLLFPATWRLTIQLIRLTKSFGRWVKRLFISRKEAEAE